VKKTFTNGQNSRKLSWKGYYSFRWEPHSHRPETWIHFTTHHQTEYERRRV